MKKMSLNVITSSFLLSLLCLTPIKTTLASYSYSDVYSFGDSLSDGGFIDGSRFIADGDIHKTFNEILALNYLNREFIPYTQGGNNFAQSGGSTVSTQNQLNEYLQRSGGNADPNALYILWVGSNDIPAIILDQITDSLGVVGDIIKTISSKTMPYLPQMDIYTSQDNIISQISQLLAAGSKTIVVPTLPYHGYTPSSSYFLVEGLRQITGIDLSNQLRAILSEKTFSNDEERRNVVVDANYQLFSNFLPFIPKELYQTIYDVLYSTTTNLVKGYNEQLDERLMQFVSQDIIRLDVNAMLLEAIYDPEGFGFTNSLSPQCSIAVAAPNCNRNVASYDNQIVSLFSDLAHPSWVAHRIMADYMQSVIDAPYYIISLSETLDKLRNKPTQILNAHKQDLRINAPTNSFSVFGGYSGGSHKTEEDGQVPSGKIKDNSGTVGVSLKLNPSWVIGGALSFHTGDYVQSERLQYDYTSLDTTLFTQYTHQSGFWGTLNLYYSAVDFDNIERRMLLNTKLRIEQGGTKGHIFGLNTQLGYDYWITPNISTGPTMGVEWSTTTVKGYEENANNSTSMKFQEQKYNRTTGSIGWGVNTKSLRINPYAQVEYHRNFSNKDKVARGSIKTSALSFSRTKESENKGWVQATVGANSNVTKNMNIYTSVSYSSAKDVKGVNYGIGVRYSF